MAEAARPVLSGYGGGGFRVAGAFVAGSILINRDRMISWPVSSAAGITLESVAPILADGAELLLLGCGRSLVPVAPALRAALKQRGVAVEPMDTGAASRTYTALVSEGRRVAAALIAID
jgi:uncharacterized protein